MPVSGVFGAPRKIDRKRSVLAPNRVGQSPVNVWSKSSTKPNPSRQKRIDRSGSVVTIAAWWIPGMRFLLPRAVPLPADATPESPRSSSAEREARAVLRGTSRPWLLFRRINPIGPRGLLCRSQGPCPQLGAADEMTRVRPRKFLGRSGELLITHDCTAIATMVQRPGDHLLDSGHTHRLSPAFALDRNAFAVPLRDQV